LIRNAKTPLIAELQLSRNIPADLIYEAHHWLILHGRYVCKARKPLCSQCGLKEFCRFFSDKNDEK
jgi:endonuclease-3